MCIVNAGGINMETHSYKMISSFNYSQASTYNRNEKPGLILRKIL